MSIEQICRITTVEGKTYELPSKDDPKLWEVSLSIASLGARGRPLGSSTTVKCVQVERQTLVNAGLLPQATTDQPRPEPSESPEDLILRLLEHVGVFPEQ